MENLLRPQMADRNPSAPSRTNFIQLPLVSSRLRANDPAGVGSAEIRFHCKSMPHCSDRSKMNNGFLLLQQISKSSPACRSPNVGTSARDARRSPSSVPDWAAQFLRQASVIALSITGVSARSICSFIFVVAAAGHISLSRILGPQHHNEEVASDDFHHHRSLVVLGLQPEFGTSSERKWS